MRGLDYTVLVIGIIGALNWGLIGLFRFDLVAFLFGNMRYFVTSLGRGIGTFLAGVLLSYSLSSLFLGAAIATLIQSIMLFDIERLRKNRNYN